MPRKPKISILLCTYNSEKVLKSCLDPILSQTYKNFEVLCIDGGSVDNTLNIIQDYMKNDDRIRVVINKKRLPEGEGYGKWLGFREAQGEIVGIIDHDNILQNSFVFERVVNLFAKYENSMGILGGLKHDFYDEKIVRVLSMFGGDFFFGYRSIDFQRHLKVLNKKDYEDYELIRFDKENISITGGNCFFYLKKYIQEIGGYSQDVIVVRDLVMKNKMELIVLKNATKHYAEKNLFMLMKKKFFWSRSFFGDERKDTKKASYLPKNRKERTAFIKNFFYNMLIIPNIIYSIYFYKKFKDPLAFILPYLSFVNTIAYGLLFARKEIK